MATLPYLSKYKVKKRNAYAISLMLLMNKNIYTCTQSTVRMPATGACDKQGVLTASLGFEVAKKKRDNLHQPD